MALSDHPQWLISMLDAEFYEECKEHQDKHCNFFCKDCISKVFCAICSKTKHEHHNVLQVYKTSNRTSVRTKDISKFLIIYDIHAVISNSYPTVFLHPKQEESLVFRPNATCRCETCGYQLANSSKNFKFCSIACKFKSDMNSIEDSISYKDIRASTEVSSLKTSETADQPLHPICKSRNEDIRASAEVSSLKTCEIAQPLHPICKSRNEDIHASAEVSSLKTSEIAQPLHPICKSRNEDIHASAEESSLKTCEIAQSLHPIRKRRKSRKGIPIRSPPF